VTNSILHFGSFFFFFFDKLHFGSSCCMLGLLSVASRHASRILSSRILSSRILSPVLDCSMNVIATASSATPPPMPSSIKTVRFSLFSSFVPNSFLVTPSYLFSGTSNHKGTRSRRVLSRLDSGKREAAGPKWVGAESPRRVRGGRLLG
jgi:hypothetical protein